jgi:3-oxoacyl-(acyl-carrier-protein) synthase
MNRATTSQGRRAVVTGVGVVAPNGIGVPAFWDSLVQGRSGGGPITLFDASHLEHRIAAEVKGFDPRVHLPAGVKWKRLARHTQFALSALELAVQDAGLTAAHLDPDRPVFVALGVSTSAIEIVEIAAHSCQTGGVEKLKPWLVWASQPNAVTATLAERLPARVSVLTLSTACQAGMDALLAAREAVCSGRAEVAVAGGADAPITASTCASFGAGRLLSSRNDDPARASRPFDRERDGGVLAEGAGVLVIESLEHARRRGATPWLELCAGASSTDVPGSPTASGMGEAMAQALANAHLQPEQVDGVCAHGPSDLEIDRVESAMIRQVLGRRAYRIPVFSIKGVTGNPLAATGPLEVIAAGLALREATVPPTANYQYPDPDCDLDYVPEARRNEVDCLLVNVHGMGGGNSVIVVRKPPRC